MSTSRNFDRICAIVLVLTLIVTVLFMNGQSIGIELVVDADSEAHSDNEYFTENDQLSGWDTSTATYITLEGDTVSISGNNAYEYNGSVVITGSGQFVITGTLDNGYICVDANANSKVWILLNGVDISCSDNACLRVDEADKVFLTLAEGTANTLTGGEELSEEALADGTYGVIFAHDDLTINGSGSLQINAGYRHGIKANDDLVITGGTITIDAPADGIHVNDSFRLKDASVDITAGDDGILTENEESFFYMESGEITLHAEGDGIHSSGNVMIAGGTIIMDAGDDGIHADGDIEIEDGVIEMNSCYEGIEGATITVSGGEITIYPTDDGFNASSGSTSEDGMFPNGGGNPGNMGFSGNGMQPPEGTEFSSGNSMQPPEGAGMTSPAVDEADNMPAQIQKAGTEQNEQQENQQNEQQNEQQETQQDVENYIRISGGTITIINENGNDADGLDSNGNIFITGGDIRISLSDTGMNNAIDAATENGGVARISGGTIIACGSSSMAEGFDQASSQCSVLYTVSSGTDSGTYLSIKDAEGKEILSWEVPCSFSSALLSSPDMQIGEACTIAAGENEETIALSEVSTALGESQSAMPEESTNGDERQKAEVRQGQENDSAGFMPGGQGPAAQKPAAQGADTVDPADEEAAGGAESASALSYDKNVWTLMAFSFLVLGTGLLLAKKYKRR